MLFQSLLGKKLSWVILWWGFQFSDKCQKPNTTKLLWEGHFIFLCNFVLLYTNFIHFLHNERKGLHDSYTIMAELKSKQGQKQGPSWASATAGTGGGRGPPFTLPLSLTAQSVCISTLLLLFFFTWYCFWEAYEEIWFTFFALATRGRLYHPLCPLTFKTPQEREAIGPDWGSEWGCIKSWQSPSGAQGIGKELVHKKRVSLGRKQMWWSRLKCIANHIKTTTGPSDAQEFSFISRL